MFARQVAYLLRSTARFTACSFVTSLILLLAAVIPGFAQGTQHTWTPPVNISNSPALSVNPFITGDQAGNIHVVWTEASGGENAPPDTIYYTTHGAAGWSEPIDILAVTQGSSRLLPAALEFDPYGRLVLLSSRNRGLDISFADSATAQSAKAWQTKSLDADSLINGADLVIDDRGVYHVAYAANNQQIRYLVSSDAGETWQEAEPVFDLIDSSFAVTEPAIAADENGAIYIAWTRTSEDTNWSAVGVWFSRSLDGGLTWSQPTELVSGVGYGWSSLHVESSGRLHLFWIGSLAIGGRYHRWSDDMGETWSETITISPPDQSSGYAGPVRPLIDSLERLSVVFPGLGAGKENIWHSQWSGWDWMTPVVISGDLPNSQLADATMTRGHLAHAVWIEYKSGDIWYTSSDTSSPPTAQAPLRSLPSVIQATPSGDGGKTQPTATEMPALSVNTPQLLDSDAEPVGLGNSTVLAISVIPAVALVAGVVLVALRKRGLQR